MTKDRPKLGANIGPMLRLVLATGATLAPFATPILKRRLRRGKEDPLRWREKLGEATAVRPDGPLIWLHGVGVGEVMALRGLIDALSTARPDLSFLVTSSARSSGEVIAANLPPRTQHQYLPLDLPRAVSAFLDHWQPDLAVWSDQEIWPRLTVEAAKRAIPLALVAARLSDKSAQAKARFGRAYGDLYGLLDLRHAQDDATSQRLRDLVGKDVPVTVTASLKPAAAPLVDDPDLRDDLASLGRPIWVAASAHRADIDVALAAHALGRNDTLLIIAPRAMGDADYIDAACAKLGLNTRRRSTHGLPDQTCDVFVADSFGELGVWYRAAFAALIGGTFDTTQGHNPWEAVALDCAVLHGPNVDNFARDFAQLAAGNGARLVRDSSDLATSLKDPTLPDMIARASAVRAAASKGMQTTTDALIGLLKV